MEAGTCGLGYAHDHCWFWAIEIILSIASLDREESISLLADIEDHPTFSTLSIRLLVLLAVHLNVDNLKLPVRNCSSEVAQPKFKSIINTALQDERCFT